MVPYPNGHDVDAKALLEGQTLAAGRSALQDTQDAVRNIFLHPNVGPFIGRQLIQRLVTGDPSPAYVARVAAAFNDNGAGVRGDMKAVVRDDPHRPRGARAGQDRPSLRPAAGTGADDHRAAARHERRQRRQGACRHGGGARPAALRVAVGVQLLSAGPHDSGHRHPRSRIRDPHLELGGGPGEPRLRPRLQRHRRRRDRSRCDRTRGSTSCRSRRWPTTPPRWSTASPTRSSAVRCLQPRATS